MLPWPLGSLQPWHLWTWTQDAVSLPPLGNKNVNFYTVINPEPIQFTSKLSTVLHCLDNLFLYFPQLHTFPRTIEKRWKRFTNSHPKDVILTKCQETETPWRLLFPMCTCVYYKHIENFEELSKIKLNSVLRRISLCMWHTHTLHKHPQSLGPGILHVPVSYTLSYQETV